MQASKHQASLFRDDWLERARISGVKMLVSIVDTLEKHRDGILANYDYSISIGPLEGTNNKIKTLQRQVYGFRDMQFFELKIFGLHETKYALVG